MNARLDEMYSERTSSAVCYSKWGQLNNFEFIMNRAYALNRDRLKCRVCGGWLISTTPCAHRVNPYLDCYNNRRIKAKLKGLPPAIHRQQALSAA